MSREANFAIIEDTPQRMMIKDLGPWDKHLTVTNDAEGVVKRLFDRLGGRRLFAMCSDGSVDELLLDQDYGTFLGFRPHSGFKLIP